MKSQHRHELQTNELGKVADKVAGSLGEFFDANGNKVLVGFCVLMVAAALVIYKVRRHRSEEAVAWQALATARNAEDYKSVAKSHTGTTAAQWARVHEGESRLSEGTQLLFTNVESGMSELKLAREALQGMVDEKGAPPEIRERALFGLARCLETMSDGSEGDAIKAYQALLREFPSTTYKKDAETRIEALGSGSSQEFYAWFAKYDRPKPAEKRPRDRKADDDLTTDAALSDPDEKAAAPGDEGADPLKVPVNLDRDPEPTTDAPATEGEKTPAPEDRPSTESQSEKPASEKPASEKPAADATSP